MPWRLGGAVRAASVRPSALGSEALVEGASPWLRHAPALEGLLALGMFVAVAAHDAMAGASQELGLKQWMAGVFAALLMVDAALRARDDSRLGLLSRLARADAPGRVAFVSLGAALLAIGLFAFRDYQVDDAFITFRYAQNLISHGQITWNPGEASVEGYSNFLWLLLSAAAILVGVEPLVVSRIASVACLLVAAWLVRRLASRIGASTRAARLSALTFLAIPAFAFWAMSGLETASVVALGLGLLDAIACDLERGRVPWRASLVAILLMLSRPEAPLFILLALAPLAWSSEARVRRFALLVAVWSGIAIAPYLAWKWLTFGSLVANSAVAKAGALRGLPIVTQAYLFAFPFVLLAVARAARGSSRIEQQIWLIGAGYALAGLQVATQVAHQFRFFLPVIAGICVVAGPALERLASEGVPAPRRRSAFAAIVLAVLLFGVAPIFDMHSHARLEATALERAHASIGRTLAATYRGEGLLAASDCGLIPYHSRMRTRDLWGLNDARIAREGVDPSRVMAERPDVVILHSLNPELFRGRESYDLAMHPAVEADPGLALRTRTEFAGYWLWVWSRRPLVPTPHAAAEFTPSERLSDTSGHAAPP